MTLRNKDILEDIPKLAVLKESESGVLSGNYGKIKHCFVIQKRIILAVVLMPFLCLIIAVLTVLKLQKISCYFSAYFLTN